MHLAHCTILEGAIHKKITLWLIHPLWLCSAQPRQFYAMAQTAVPPKAAKLNQHFVYITPSFCSPKQSVAENIRAVGLYQPELVSWICHIVLTQDLGEAVNLTRPYYPHLQNGQQ